MSDKFRELLEKYCVTDYDVNRDCLAGKAYQQQVEAYGLSQEDPGDVQVPQINHWGSNINVDCQNGIPDYIIEDYGGRMNITWDNYNSSDPMWNEPMDLGPTWSDIRTAVVDLMAVEDRVLRGDLGVAVVQENPDVCENVYNGEETWIPEVGFGPLVPAAKTPDPEPQYDHHVHIPLPGEGSYRVTWDGEVHTGKKSFP